MSEAVYPAEILERSGHLVRLNGLLGWVVEADLARPCGGCHGQNWGLVEVQRGEHTHAKLCCLTCCPPKNRGEVAEFLLVRLAFPAVDLSAVGAPSSAA